MENLESRRLISLYKEHKCLWDPSDKKYTNRGAREDAWRRINREINNVPVEELKRRMKSLSGGYRREKFREKQSRLTGSGAEDIYKSKWFAYDDFAFMTDKNDPGKRRDTYQDNRTCVIESDSGSGDRDSNVPRSVKEATSEQVVLCEQPVVSDQAAEFEQPAAKPVSIQPKPKKKRKKSSNNTEEITDETLSEAFQLLHQCAQPAETNPCAAFGHYIATELNKYDPTTLAYVKNAISQIIFEADMGRYKAGQKRQGKVKKKL